MGSIEPSLPYDAANRLTTSIDNVYYTTRRTGILYSGRLMKVDEQPSVYCQFPVWRLHKIKDGEDENAYLQLGE